MTELMEIDPKLAAVRDKQSRRNLLDSSDPNPLTVDTSAGRPVRFALLIENGPEGLIDLAITSDEPWLQPETKRLTLVGGESGECILSAAPEGDTEFANLLLTWEGTEKTLSASVMVMRKLAAPAAPASQQPASPQPAARPTPPPPQQGTRPSAPPTGSRRQQREEAVQTLVRFIDGCGGPDKFIDVDEEHKIFRKGGALELSLTEIESILNRRCAEGGWTRQTRLTEKLTAMLHEATKDDGVIDQQEYDHVVNFAVRRLMPRRDADEHCITIILDNAWKPKESMLNKWFTKKRKHYGL